MPTPQFLALQHRVNYILPCVFCDSDQCMGTFQYGGVSFTKIGEFCRVEHSRFPIRVLWTDLTTRFLSRAIFCKNRADRFAFLFEITALYTQYVCV